MGSNSARWIINISIPLSVLIAIVSFWGIAMPGMYAKETENWRLQSLAQDWFDLCVLPASLLTTAKLALRYPGWGRPLWMGVLLYVAYTFTIYTFTVHFSVLFVPYCVVLGTSFYILVWTAIQLFCGTTGTKLESTRVQKITAWFLIVIACLFYFLWLSDIVVSILENREPEVLKLAGLPANPVHVLDLAFLLPALFVTGTLLLKGYEFGKLAANALLVFMLLMNLTIAWINWYSDAGPALTIVMLSLAAVCAVLLLLNIK